MFKSGDGWDRVQVQLGKTTVHRIEYQKINSWNLGNGAKLDAWLMESVKERRNP